MTVEAAILHLRRVAIDKETIYTCYVTDRERRLIGIVTAKDLLISEPETKISDIMERSVIYAYTGDEREEVARKIEKYGFLALPVVDNEKRLVGIVTVDDAIDVIQEEASEDIEKMAAILPSEKPYLRTGVFETFKARIPWLLFLMISATFTGAIISKFELQLTTYAALIVFIPMLMGTGGNSGSQASVTVIRALSLGDVEFSDIWRVIWKELSVSAICGLALSVINFGKLYLIDYLLLNNFDAMVAIPEMLVVCITLFLVVVVAKFIGCTLPIIAKRLGFDPAVMASPLVTTILDTFSLLIYFTIAALILKI
jgi:magnesium transporter